MSTERKLLPRDIRFVLAWAEDWKKIPTRKDIARKLGVSEPTITRIVRNGGYLSKRKQKDIGLLAASFDAKKTVPREPNARSELNGSHQGGPDEAAI